tara:strand:+ start:17729 stop:18607 length:879 start_codon:yes stop_codon:yes gene_type:complete
MAFEFRDILPAVGAVIGFGFGGPGGAALGSGIGSLARGDEADEALKNAALGYVGGKGTQFLGNKIPGFDKFLSGIPVAGDFVKGGMDKDIFGTAIGKGKEFLGLDPASQVEKTILKNQQLIDAIDASDASDEIKNALKNNVYENMNMGASAEDSLLNLRNILGLTGFATIFGNILDKDQSGGPSMQDFIVTTDTAFEGFDKPTEIKNVRNFADGGIVSLAEGGFPRKNGKIEGPGTETSDDIPAMLSDGEFVVNARTVRALGESMGAKDDMDARERGSSFLYSLQEKYGGTA